MSSIKIKLAAIIGLLLLLAAGIALFCGQAISGLATDLADLAGTKMPLQTMIIRMNVRLTQFRVDEASHILSTGPEDMDAREHDMAAIKEEIATLLSKIKPLLGNGAERAKIDEFEGLFSQYLEANKKLLPVSRKYDSHEHDNFLDEASRIFNEESAPIYKKASALVVDLANSTVSQVKTASDDTVASVHSKLTVVMAAGIVTVILGFASIWFVNFAISKPIGAMAGVLLRLAQGDKTVTIPYTKRRDEVGENARAADVFKQNLINMEKMQAEQKENEARAAAEKEAAMQKMSAEFEAAVGGIVQAATAGDFSQRVNLQGKTGLILNVGGSINSLCGNVSKALDDLIRMLNALAEGDLTQRITAEYRGNFALLRDSANKTAERIGTTMSEIKSAARDVASASAEIATSTTDLSQRTEEQAAALEQTSASMEQISATVKKNAEYAQQANVSAGDTREVAQRGGQVVTEAVQAMARIEESSRKISDIIGVIDEIARQTNLLALNAAVEAARAGEAGRGFAVVASEVRSLAQRSSQAAKDIKDLITSSNGQVKDGVDLVNRAGGSLNEIVDSIKKVAEIVADIANASAEQAGGVDQVGKALNQMDEVTQQNSALVEENAATSKSLEQQAEEMDRLIAFFRVGDAKGEAAPAKAAAAGPAQSKTRERAGRLRAVTAAA